MSFNPLDLFNSEINSNNQSSIGLKPSSPIQETQAIKELQLQEEHERLLLLRNQLKQDINDLENEWNISQTNVEDDSSKFNEENELIFQLLLNNDQNDNQDNEPTEVNDIEDNLVEFNPNEFSTAPLQDWDLRLSYIKKFYPFLQVIEPTSKLLLTYDSNNKPQLTKIIKFQLLYKRLFQFEISIHLININQKYTISKLEIIKLSNNKYNTILIQLIEYHINSKNINEFLYSLNDLHKMIIDRKKLFDELKQEYQKDLQIEINKIKNDKFELIWDIIFDQQQGTFNNLILVNSQYTKIFQDMLKLYGNIRAIRHFIDSHSL